METNDILDVLSLPPEEGNDILETVRNLFFIFEKKTIRVYIIGQNLGTILVGTRFVADRNGVGFAREKALTISFV